MVAYLALLLLQSPANRNSPPAAPPATVRTGAVVHAGKSYDLVVLPEQTHRPEARSMMYAMEAHKRYLVDHLKP